MKAINLILGILFLGLLVVPSFAQQQQTQSPDDISNEIARLQMLLQHIQAMQSVQVSQPTELSQQSLPAPSTFLCSTPLFLHNAMVEGSENDKSKIKLAFVPVDPALVQTVSDLVVKVDKQSQSSNSNAISASHDQPSASASFSLTRSQRFSKPIYFISLPSDFNLADGERLQYEFTFKHIRSDQQICDAKSIRFQYTQPVRTDEPAHLRETKEFIPYSQRVSVCPSIDANYQLTVVPSADKPLVAKFEVPKAIADIVESVFVVVSKRVDAPVWSSSTPSSSAVEPTMDTFSLRRDSETADTVIFATSLPAKFTPKQDEPLDFAFKYAIKHSQCLLVTGTRQLDS